MNSIKIKSMEIYHPENAVNNDYYIELYKQKGQDVQGALEGLFGRKNRFIINNDQENSLTMAIESATKVLAKSGLEGEDIDMIVFTSQTPESFFPTNAILLHQAIDGAKHALTIDMNVNCAGMLVAIEQVSRSMLSNRRVNRALIVGADAVSLFSSPEDFAVYSNFGDTSCAVILEKTEEAIGFMDAIYDVDTSDVKALSFPVDGFSSFAKNPNACKFVKELSKPRNIVPDIIGLLDRLLAENNMTMNDIDFIAPSQFVLKNIEAIQEHYGLSKEQMLYVGDTYGYSGTTSPLMALYEGIESGKVKRGDQILFYTIGTGNLIIAMLFKY